jgi:hypothetical protein
MKQLRSAALHPLRRRSLLPGASCAASACSSPRPGSSKISRPFFSRVTFVMTAPKCWQGSASAAADARLPGWAAAAADGEAAPPAPPLLLVPLALLGPGTGASRVTALVMKIFSSSALRWHRRTRQAFRA